MAKSEFKVLIAPPAETPVWVQWIVITKTIIGFLFGLLLGYAIWGPLP